MCGLIKPLKDFHKAKASKDGYNTSCKVCRRARQKAYYATPEGSIKRATYMRKYMANNKDKRSLINKKYNDNNKEEINRKAKIYTAENKERIQQYQIDNKETILAGKKRYYWDNRDTLLSKKKVWARSFCKSNKKLKQLPAVDEPVMVGGFLTVACKHCGTRFKPVNEAVSARVAAINGTAVGENNLYCSEQCKQLCPTYRFKPLIQVDPRSILADEEKTKKRRIRTCQRKVRKALLELQDDEFGFTFCEKCGKRTAAKDLQLHHTKPVSIFGNEAIDASTQILVCKSCHPTHAQCLLQL